MIAIASGFGCARGGEPGHGHLAQTWTTEDGLPSNEVVALVQSRDGYLWIGTPGGLTRFDGDRFLTFRGSEIAGLAGNRILSLCDDNAGGIWIGTEGGGVAHMRSDTSEMDTRVQGLSSSNVLSVCVDEAGELWAGTAAGLNRWQVNRFVSYMKVDGLPDEMVTALRTASPGGLLVGTATGAGWFRDGHLTVVRTEPALPVGRVASVQLDRSGRLWMAAESGIWRADTQQNGLGAAHRIWPEACVSLVLRRDGDVCWGTVSGRLMTLDQKGGEPRELHRSASPPVALLEDRESNLWVGSRQGVTRLKPRLFRFVEPRLDGEATAFAIERSGVDVLARRDGRSRFFVPAPGPGDGSFSAFARIEAMDSIDGVFWAGTSGEGLWRWDGKEMRTWSQRDGLSDIFVESVLADGPDSVWVGTRNGGLNHVTGQGIRRFLTPWGYSGNYASVLAAQSDGTLWIGTSGDGLFALREGRFTRHQRPTGLPDDRITALIVCSADEVWVGTSAGLGLWHGGGWHTFGRKTGLPHEAIDQMREDALGTLWLGCGQVLLRFRKDELKEVAAGRRDTAHPVPYGRSDGLQGATFIPGAQVSARWGREQLLFLTTRGPLVFEPGGIRANTNPPPVLIQEVLVGGEVAPPGRTARVPPGRRSVSVRFAAPSLVAPEKVRFRCRLAGYENDWVELGGARTVRYPQVPPGDFRFEVTACNNDGLWNPDGASIAVEVDRFWWETVWFRIGLAGSVGGVAASILVLRRLRRMEIERLRVRIAGDLHDEIGSSLWSITLLSKMLQQVETLGDEERRDAGEIHRIATQTSNALRDIVWLINPGLDTVQDLVLRMRDHLSAAFRGVETRLDSEHADPMRKLPLEWRQSLFLAFKEAVTNAARHGGADRIWVTLSDRDGVLELKIEDDGKGFVPGNAGRGHGLSSLRRRAEAIGGHLILESAPGSGTTVVLRCGRRDPV